MHKSAKAYYRQVRHNTRVRLNFARNWLILIKLRARLKRESPKRKLIAVMLLEHLGDIVACEPVVRYLREKDPKAYIVWGVKKTYRELTDSNPHIDMTLTVHCLTERMLLMNSGVFDKVVDLHLSDRYCSLCRRPLKKKDASPIRLETYFSYGNILSSFAQAAGLPPIDAHPKVYIPETAVRRVDRLNLPENFIAVNCSSNSLEKDWPVEKWLQLLAQLQQDCNLPVVETGIQPLLHENNKLKYIDVCGRLSILESAEVIRRARLFIGVDSGPAHLANAVGTPGVVVMGSYLGFRSYMPFSGSYKDGACAEMVYADGPVAEIPVDTVFSAAKHILYCNAV